MSFHTPIQLPVPLRNLRQNLVIHKRLIDLAVAAILACTVLLLYAMTTGSGVLDGDQGEFQYMPAVLGIPHPSGFPLYILLGHLWSGLPIGTLAYRMNLFSGFWGALTVAALYLVLRWQKVQFVAALAAPIALAVVPQFWQYSTVAAVYRLHDFLIVLVLGMLAQWERTREDRWLHYAALAFGLDLANHLTIVFFAPFTALLLILVAGKRLYQQPRLILVSALYLIAPLLLYLYFPIRGAQLASPQLLSGWPENVARGIVSPYYHNDPAGLWTYLVGGNFYGAVTGHWQWTIDKLVANFLPTMLQTINWPLALLSLVGAVSLFRRRPRLAMWLIGNALFLLILAVQYTSLGLEAVGQLSSYAREYYLPAFILVIVLAAYGLDQVVSGQWSVISDRFSRLAPRLSPLVLLAVIVFMGATIADLASRRSDALIARSADIEGRWDEIKAHPPEKNSLLVAHWGDLTPLWYYQQAEGWRTDLLTAHPPDDRRVDEWLATDRPLYLAGALLGWAPNVAKQYQLTPWGPLVRVSRQDFAPASPLKQKIDATFAGNEPVLQLTGFETNQSEATVGGIVDTSAYWTTLEDVKLDEYVVSLSLSNDNGSTRIQNLPLVVSWMPNRSLQKGQVALANYHYTVPWGTPPGDYKLHLDVYSIQDARNLDAVVDGTRVENGALANLHIKPAAIYPDTVVTDHPTDTNWEGVVKLLGYDGDITEIRTGDSRSIDLIWKAASEPQPDLRATFSLSNGADRYLAGSGPLNAKYASEQWQPGEIVRGAQTLVIPANLTPGDYQLTVEIHRGATLLPQCGGECRGLVLGWVHVVGREHNFTIPAIPNSQITNFDNRISLLGYALDAKISKPGDSVHLSLYWQGQRVLNTSYKFFLHVVDAQGKIWAQHDNIPGEGASPTTAWLPDEVASDTFDVTLPLDMPPGKYEMRVGFYDSATNKRLVVADTGSPSDYVTLSQTIEVTP